MVEKRKWLVTRVLETKVFAETASEAITKSQKYLKANVMQVHAEIDIDDEEVARDPAGFK